MSRTALIVVDVQTALFNGNLYKKQMVINNIKCLISTARNCGTEIIYVRHQDTDGGELEYGAEGWQILDEVAPISKERIFDKQYNSAFVKTNFRQYLDSRKITELVLVGLQTEYCIDATCKSAFEHGYHVIIPEETNTTFDNEYLSGEKLYEFFNYRIWNNRYAEVLPVKEVEKIFEAGKGLQNS